MIRTVDNLIEWLEDNIGNPIHRWSLENDKIEVLGFFLYLYADPFGTYVIKLSSKHGGTHYLRIIIDSFGRIYNYQLIFKPEWRFWNPEDSTNPLFAGDNPEKYKELRDAAQKLYQAKKSTSNDTPLNRS